MYLDFNLLKSNCNQKKDSGLVVFTQSELMRIDLLHKT